jgi:APA family basic amino acid/polyamine antiporter
MLTGHHTVAGLTGVGAIAGLTTVMLVLYYGLSRVFFAMARDGLLPGGLAVLNKKTGTPARIIVLCAVLIASVAGFYPIDTLAELVNIGTLLAFTMVCAGVLYLRYTQPELHRPFKTPFMPWVPLLGILGCMYLIVHLSWVTIIRFIIWFFIGMVVYFCYGRRHVTN